MKAVRRLGKTPAALGATTGVSGSPDILELDDGAFAVIGVDITGQVAGLADLHAKCASDERVVRVPRRTLVAARADIPADYVSLLRRVTACGERLNLDEFRAAFLDAWSGVRTRFHKVECWQSYQELDGNRSQEAFRRGELDRALHLLRLEADADRRLYADVRKRNVDYSRIRLVQEPRTDYLAYELMSYQVRAALGEVIEIVTMDAAVTLPNAELFDFLLFDRHAALVHDYGSGTVGEQVGGWLVRDGETLRALEATALDLRRWSIPLRRYLAQSRP